MLYDFDWSFNPSIKKKQVYDLAACSFIRQARDVLWLGPPGVGKSFLCQAIGRQAVKMGFVVLYDGAPDDGAPDCLRMDLMMTSNRPLEDWGKLLGDVPSATAILDRFLHHAELIQITGRSYRLRNPGESLTMAGGGSKPANAPSGSAVESKGSKPANAPPGSGGLEDAEEEA